MWIIGDRFSIMVSVMHNKRHYAFFFWLAIGIILILNLLLWIYLNQVESKFESNLQERLLSENRFISRVINDETLSMIIPGETNSIEYISILQTLESIRREDSLQSVLIMDRDGSILVASPEIISFQKESLRSDNALYTKAFEGGFITSEIQQIADEQFMSSYGPVYDIYGTVIAVQIIEAKATYFATIDTLRSQLILFSIINFIVITLIAFFLFRMINRAIRFQALIKDQEHLAQLGTMGASVAHELRNPLGIIEGSNELIRKKYGNKDDEIFDYIPAETKRLTNIINSFLLFARSPKVNKKRFNVGDLLARLKVGLENKKGIRIDFTEIKNGLYIYSDSDLLEQAILNILSNAVDAVEDQSAIQFRIDSQKDKIIFSIQNKGPLIPPETKDKIFQPFFTTKEQGTGLGLAISKRTIELLDGTIDVESNLNEGTTFKIILPK
jgi:signal transduction histidine kinase/heme exporter protein D